MNPSPAARPLILVVDNSRAVTGALNAMRHATGPLREEFAFEYVLPTGSTGRAVLEQDGYRVHELPFVEISRRKGDLLRYGPMLLLNGWRLHQLAWRQKAQVVHLNDFYNLTGYVAKALSFGRLRVVTHVRFLPQSLIQPLARTWKWLGETVADRVLCVSQAVRRYFSPEGNVQVVFDPIPGPERHPAPVPPLQRPAGPVQLLYLSNYIQGKGQDLALRAFAQAYAHNPQLRLTFVGGDMGLAKNREFREQLEAAVRAQSLTGAVTFGGFVTDVEQVIKQADILLNFSESESFSLTCLDALYYGTPLIASDCGGPAELFENGQSGLLVPNRDVPAMAAAIGQLAADPALRQQFSEAGRAYVRQKFRPAATFGQLAQVYRDVLRQA
ncbi:glycosyltransferase family 4 protein [Hymenobacter persicinus]|uniref:Glycosyltransferase family 1 protein n=1 Tax=Hymenobacter persicinus TaxID=2025506 RepID=A0A4Q5L6N5_9BACT|nr:glycosyltransferase family 4 protein [Hymenobacter persicinus]RYU75798.1 glycosyltransferase family 1 protein [Hymenobacter persicinus]